PSLISRANACRSEPIRVFLVVLGSALTPISPRRDPRGELNREADLSTEQACTQTPSRFPRAHGHQGRTQSLVGAARTRTQAAQRLAYDGSGEAAHCFHGTIEATGGLSSRGVRDQGAGRRVRVAGAQ